MKIPLLLTATINPNGMKGAKFAPEERLQMYVEAVSFYIGKLSEYAIENGTQYIVFAENSGFDEVAFVNMLKKRPNVEIEYLNIETEDFKIHLGKGYNEFLLLQKAIKKSKIIRKYGCFFKLTGRLKVLNITSLLCECYKRNENIGGGLSFLADCKDHEFYEWLGMPINGHMGECRYWFASSAFFEQIISPKCCQLNDYSTPRFLAEDMMLIVCRETRGKRGCFDRFITQAQISGKGGHHLGNGLSFFYSTDNDSLALRLKCMLRQWLRWMFPKFRA